MEKPLNLKLISRIKAGRWRSILQDPPRLTMIFFRSWAASFIQVHKRKRGEKLTSNISYLLVGGESQKPQKRDFHHALLTRYQSTTGDAGLFYHVVPWTTGRYRESTFCWGWQANQTKMLKAFWFLQMEYSNYVLSSGENSDQREQGNHGSVSRLRLSYYENVGSHQAKQPLLLPSLTPDIFKIICHWMHPCAKQLSKCWWSRLWCDCLRLQSLHAASLCLRIGQWPCFAAIFSSAPWWIRRTRHRSDSKADAGISYLVSLGSW